MKNAENYYFDKFLGCAEPKRWSKYTTDNRQLSDIYFIKLLRKYKNLTDIEKVTLNIMTG